ncbi:unnamed protein product [Ectocarpus sp. 13 AM-2016]
MSVSARWQRNAVRLVALVLFFESALSFAPPPVQQQPAQSRSSPLLPATAALQRRSSSNGSSFWPARVAVAGCRYRQRRRGAASQLAPRLAMSSSAGRNGSRPERGGGATNIASAAGGAFDVADEPGDAQSSKAQTQVPPKTGVTQTGQASRRRRQQQHHDSDFLFEQKLESVRAAVLCGSVGATSRLLAVGAGALLPGGLLREALAAPEPAGSSLLFGLAAGFAQGALFGLTYRYVVRSDREQSPSATTGEPPVPQMDGFTVGHLGDGCVAAFALTSALGQSEAPLTMAAGEFVGVLGRGGGILEALAPVLLPAAPFLPRAAADLFLYSAARLAIDRALDEGVIKPFP